MSVTEQQILAILRDPLAHDWTIQGLGMLRLYLDDEHVQRLHVWDQTQAFEDVSTIHDHPWDFTSLIVSGSMRNVRYTESEGGRLYQGSTIFCGAGGGLVGGGPELHRLISTPDATAYEPGGSYSQLAPELHESYPSTGTVSVITRRFHENRDIARVFWARGDWVSAEPRPATEAEIMRFTELALQRWNV